MPATDEKLPFPKLGRSVMTATSLSVVEEDAASEEVLALYREYRSRFGRPDLPGIVKCFATTPPVLRSMLALAGDFLFVDSSLTRTHKEMIATFVSSRNACSYCADSHGGFLLAQGASAEILCGLRSGAIDSPCFAQEEQSLLRFVLKVTSESHHIGRADIEAAMRAGWSETQLAESVHVAAFFAAFNRIANSFGLPSPHPGRL